MKDVAILLVFMMTPITCFICATYLASKGMDGWGWLIFAGIAIGGSIRYSSG